MSAALLDHLWQSTLFCGAVWLITLSLRGNSAAVRHLLWLGASLKFLVPFSALYLLGAAAGLPTPVESQPLFSAAGLEATTSLANPALSWHAFNSPLLLLMSFAWAVGVLLLVRAWLRDWRAADSISRAARPAPGSLPDVHITDADVEPSVARVFHPVVLLPTALLRSLAPAQLAAVLAHEREHIARRDNLVAHLQRLVETLFWFHPLVWFIGRNIQEERERACDEAVLADGHDPGEYAAGILAVCHQCAAAHSPRALAALSGDLTRRIGAILRGTTPRPVGSVKSLLLVCCALAAAAVPLAAGAMDGELRRHLAYVNNSRLLTNAHLLVSPAAAAGDDLRLAATGNEVVIANASLRELIALGYGVHRYNVMGDDAWLDSMRYDIRAEIPGTVADPDDFDPLALRGMVTQLLAARFDLEIYVNQRCQDPCGPRALRAREAAR